MSRIRELRERKQKFCTLRCAEFETENRSRFFLSFSEFLKRETKARNLYVK
jgi:hypothetical protein